MNDRRLEEERQAPDAEGFEVEIEEELDLEEADLEEEDLNEAMREALEAVERQGDEEEGESVEPGEGGAAPELAGLEAELASLKDRHVRSLADFENYRKRIERERAQSRRYEGLGVLSDLLPILDNLGLALEAEGDVDDLKAGVELISRQFQDLLRRHGIERIDAEGQPFDPTLHDAVSREESAEVEVATVAEVLRAGYRMGDRLVRPASVRVSVPPERPAAPEETPDPESLN